MKNESPHSKRASSDTGLANEVRPGLGTRKYVGLSRLKFRKSKGARHDREPLGRDAPLPPRAPREESPDVFAQEEERDTSVSGHASAD